PEPALVEAKVLPLPVPNNDINAPDLSDLVERGRDSVRDKPSKAKVKSSGPTDDHLTTYFRDLAEHDLLGPEDERELSQGIEDQEIMTWERVFTRADVVEHVV